MCDEVAPARHGTALLTPSLPLVWQLNALRVEVPGAGPDARRGGGGRAASGGPRAIASCSCPTPSRALGWPRQLARRGWNVEPPAGDGQRGATPIRPASAGARRRGGPAARAPRRSPRSGASSRSTADAETIRQLEEMDERFTRARGARRDFAAPPERGLRELPAAERPRGRSGRPGRHPRRRTGTAATRAPRCWRPLDAAAAAGLDPVFLVTDAGDWPQYLYRRLGFDPVDRAVGVPQAAPRGRPLHNHGDGLDPRRAAGLGQGAAPVRGPGLAHGRGAHRRLHGPRGAAAHARERRDVVLEPFAPGALAQGRDLGQRPAGARASLGLRRRRPARAGGAGRSRPATPASAPASTTATPSPRRARRWARSSGRSASARGARPSDSYTARLLADAEPARGEGARGGRGGDARGARRSRDERVAEEAADVLYHLAVLLAARGLSLADAFEVLNDRRR